MFSKGLHIIIHTFIGSLRHGRTHSTAAAAAARARPSGLGLQGRRPQHSFIVGACLGDHRSQVRACATQQIGPLFEAGYRTHSVNCMYGRAVLIIRL